MKKIIKGVVYDAGIVCHTLALSCRCESAIHCICSDPVPEAEDGDVVFYHGGWRVHTLKYESPTARVKWYDGFNTNLRLAKGYYRLRYFHSDAITDLHNQSLASGGTWYNVPAVLSAEVLFVHCCKTGTDLLRGGFHLVADGNGLSGIHFNMNERCASIVSNMSPSSVISVLMQPVYQRYKKLWN